MKKKAQSQGDLVIAPLTSSKQGKRKRQTGKTIKTQQEVRKLQLMTKTPLKTLL